MERGREKERMEGERKEGSEGREGVNEGRKEGGSKEG